MARDIEMDVLGSLIAAVSLLRRAEELGQRPSKAVASGKMFKTMLADYERAIEKGRKTKGENRCPS